MNLFSNSLILIIILFTIKLSETCPPQNQEEDSEEENNIPTWNISFMSLEEFEQKYNIIFSDIEMEAQAAKEFYKEEAEIDTEDELFKDGLANFEEKIVIWDAEDPTEFNAEKTGLLPESVEPERGLGLVFDPLAKNTLEELKILGEIYKDMNRDNFPEYWDSRSLGYVTPVKSQGSCGSCAAFATVGAIEVCLKKAGSIVPLTDLDSSEQQLVDCAYGFQGANGCLGAQMHSYPNFVKEPDTEINHENSYPYEDSQATLECQNKPYWNPGSKIDTSLVDTDCNEDKIKFFIQTFGSAIIGLYASDSGFINYGSGVFDQCSYPNHQINHAVLAIGWGTENEIPYWLIKNSWGTEWGDQGYIKVKRGTCGEYQVCAAISCSGNGNDPDPIPEENSSNEVIPCDVIHWYGEITGRVTLPRLGYDGIFRWPTLDCVDGYCSPVNPNIQDACMYICGRNPCKDLHLG